MVFYSPGAIQLVMKSNSKSCKSIVKKIGSNPNKKNNILVNNVSKNILRVRTTTLEKAKELKKNLSKSGHIVGNIVKQKYNRYNYVIIVKLRYNFEKYFA